MREKLERIASDIIQILEKKNADYGNSFFATRDEYGIDAFLVRITDKFNRLKSIATRGTFYFESYTDTIKDIIGYCLLELVYLEDATTEEKILQALQGEGYTFDEETITELVGGTD